MIYPKEYKREKNVNTEAYWDIAHKRMRHVTSRSIRVARRVAEILQGLPPALVIEYGFGNLNLAHLLGSGSWVGVDFSERAVQRATDFGFHAIHARCSDAGIRDVEIVVGIEILEHLDRYEMDAFLDQSRPAVRALFSVPQQTVRDERFPQHMRTFGKASDFAAFLRGYWPNVEVEKVHPYWLLGHGWRARV